MPDGLVRGGQIQATSKIKKSKKAFFDSFGLDVGSRMPQLASSPIKTHFRLNMPIFFDHSLVHSTLNMLGWEAGFKV